MATAEDYYHEKIVTKIFEYYFIAFNFSNTPNTRKKINVQ